MSIEIRMLGPDDAEVLERVAPDVFDHAVIPGSAAGGTPAAFVMYS